jgi:UDP-4-amino-4,6-dideoxy-N-acetyl-beta-L-altrosamine N-acetyltransferase
MSIHTSNICLKPFKQQHVEKTLEWMNDPELMPLLNRSRIIPREEHVKWCESLSTRKDVHYFAIEQKEVPHEYVGNVWLWQIDEVNSKAEVRIVIGKSSHCEKGVGTEALKAITDHAFQKMGLHKLYAYVLKFNSRALRAFQKAGYEIEGTLKLDRLSGDQFVDVCLLGVINSKFIQPTGGSRPK